MVSRKRALFACLVSAYFTSKLADIGMKSIRDKDHERHKVALDRVFLEGFDAGHKSALENRYLISRTYMRNAMLMELN